MYRKVCDNIKRYVLRSALFFGLLQVFFYYVVLTSALVSKIFVSDFLLSNFLVSCVLVM